MKVLVLGGTGTVGSQVVAELVARAADPAARPSAAAIRGLRARDGRGVEGFGLADFCDMMTE